MKIYFFLALLLCMPYWGLGQGVPAFEENVWKRRVTRIISIGDTVTEERKKLITEHKDSLLVELLVKSALLGKITLYHPWSNLLNEALSKKQIEKIIYPEEDEGLEIEDPITPQMTRRVIRKDPTYPYEVKKYRILEDWVFNQNIKEITIQIIGIAPLRDIYGSYDNIFRGSIAMFWLKYDDSLKNILRKYEQAHPKINITTSIWNDYFSNTINISASNTPAILTRKSSMVISQIVTAPPDTKLRYANEYGWFCQTIIDSIMSGRIVAYLNDGSLFTKKLSKERVSEISKPIADTTYFIDPVTGEKMRHVEIKDFNPSYVTRYKLLQQWQMDRVTGKTTIKPIGIIPILDLPENYRTNKDGTEMFLLKFEDVNNIIKRSQMFHPENNLALSLWLSYFSEPE